MSDLDHAPRRAEKPAVPGGVDDPLLMVAYGIAAAARRSQHSQLCPVWTRRAKAAVDACDCWILRTAQTDAVLVLGLLADWLARRAVETRRSVADDGTEATAVETRHLLASAVGYESLRDELREAVVSGGTAT